MRTWTEFNRDRIPSVAAGATFYSLLALFPALGAFVSLYGLIANVDDARKQIVALGGLLPSGAIEVLSDQMVRLAGADHAGLGLTLFLSLGLSLWSANAGLKAIIAGLNVAYEETERRNFIKLNGLSLGFTVATTLFSVLAVATLVAAPGVLKSIGLGGLAAASFVRWPALALVVVTFSSLLYRYGPSREHARWRWVTPGGLLASLGWMAMSILFSAYVGHFGNYNKTYGALGAVVGFMTWIWLSLNVVLLGAELNAELERQTEVDTTTGLPMPKGLRGAVVSDT